MSETEPVPVPPEPLIVPALTEPPVVPPPVPPKAAMPPAAVKPPQPRRTMSLWPLLGVIGFLLLAGGEAYLWRLYQSEAGQAAQISALQSQLAQLQQAPTPAQPATATQTPPQDNGIQVQADIAQKLAAVTAQINAMQTQMAADHGALTTLQANNVDVTKLSAKMAELNRLDSARLALESGRPLGDIANAPPALAKFATTPPPTLAALILSYPAASRAAAAASVAGTANGSYWNAVLARLENLVTISQGSHVIIGAPASGVLLTAGQSLNAGDLAGAVAQLSTLSAPVQAAMGNWLIQARDLLAARAAIITAADQP